MQVFNFNKKSNAIIMVCSHKTSTFACQLQKRNYTLSLKSLTYTSLRLSGVPYFFRQADYCLLFFWMTLVLSLIQVSLNRKTACTKNEKTVIAIEDFQGTRVFLTVVKPRHIFHHLPTLPTANWLPLVFDTPSQNRSAKVRHTNQK